MNQNHNIEMDEIIARWLASEATDAELQKLNAWSELNTTNKDYVNQLAKIWDAATDESTVGNSQNAWEKVQQHIQSPNKQRMNFTIIYRAVLAAAACLGLFIAGRYFYNNQNKNIEPPLANSGLFIQAGNEVYTTTLPDQTVVQLQPHSSISADTGFGKNNRNIKLTGSAHFKTKHGIKNRFIVQCNETVIEDIGTAFWVRNQKNETRVLVTEGQVKVLAYTDSAFLNIGDSALVSRLEQKLKTVATKTAAKVEEVKDKTLVFLKTELKKVTLLLNNTYQSDIRLGNPAIANCKLTASFKDESLDNVLDVIRETFNLEIRKEGNIIYLEGKGCQ